MFWSGGRVRRHRIASAWPLGGGWAGGISFKEDAKGFSAPDDKTLCVRVGVKAVFRLDLMNDCGDLTFRQSLSFERQPATPWICSPLDATIIYREAGITERCPVTAIHRLTPDERSALPKKDRP